MLYCIECIDPHRLVPHRKTCFNPGSNVQLRRTIPTHTSYRPPAPIKTNTHIDHLRWTEPTPARPERNQPAAACSPRTEPIADARNRTNTCRPGPAPKTDNHQPPTGDHQPPTSHEQQPATSQPTTSPGGPRAGRPIRIPRTSPQPQRGPNQQGATGSSIDQLLTFAVVNMMSQSQEKGEDEERRKQERQQNQMFFNVDDGHDATTNERPQGAAQNQRQTQIQQQSCGSPWGQQ